MPAEGQGGVSGLIPQPPFDLLARVFKAEVSADFGNSHRNRFRALPDANTGSASNFGLPVNPDGFDGLWEPFYARDHPARAD